MTVSLRLPKSSAKNWELALLNSLKNQYERFPYPPTPFFALPRRGQGEALKNSANPERILVIGGGTFEPLLVAQAHPQAKEVVCIDLSETSIELLERRIRFFKIARPFTRLPNVRSFAGDFTSREFQNSTLFKNFDYVIASNVLHHSKDPADFLAKATAALKIGGTLRVVTYPASSRIWMRTTSRWLKLHGVEQNPNLKKAALQCVRQLPITHPIRACYESHQERSTPAGIVDAFLNACENPLTPLQWKAACAQLGLKLVAETQDKNSSSQLVDQFSKNSLDIWEKLQIVDDTWELCSNPILWFEKTADKTSATAEALVSEQVFSLPQSEKRGSFTSPLRLEMAKQFSRAGKLLQKTGHSLEEWISWLSKEIGPRVWPKAPDEILRGLSITEYPLDEILSLSKTPAKPQPNWDLLQKQFGAEHRLYFNNLSETQLSKHSSWKIQAELIALELGPAHSEISYEIIP
jgi:SAM-dependent methyltransferase